MILMTAPEFLIRHGLENHPAGAAVAELVREHERLVTKLGAIEQRLAEMQRRYADTCDLLDREAEHNGRR